MRSRWIPLALAALLAACGPEPFYIGVMLEPAGVDAARLAVVQVNFTEGIEQRPLRLRMFRLQPTTPAEAIRDTLRKWAGDSSVVGAVVTSARVPASEVSSMLSRGGLPHLFVTSEPRFTSADSNRFYMVPPAQQEGEFMAEVAGMRDGARTAVIYPDTETGRAMHAALVAALRTRGAAPVAEGMYPAETDEAQLLGVAAEVAAERPNIVYWIGDVAELTAVYPSLRGLLRDGVVVANSRAETRHLYFNPGGHYTGLRFVRFLDVRGESPELREFLFRNGSWSGGETTSRDVIVYDAVIVLSEGIRTGAHDRAAVRDYLQRLAADSAVEGIGGSTAFTLPGPAAPREYNLAEVVSGGVRTAQHLDPPYAAEDEDTAAE